MEETTETFDFAAVPAPAPVIAEEEKVVVPEPVPEPEPVVVEEEKVVVPEPEPVPVVVEEEKVVIPEPEPVVIEEEKVVVPPRTSLILPGVPTPSRPFKLRFGLRNKL
jgi:hypothetical protein